MSKNFEEFKELKEFKEFREFEAYGESLESHPDFLLLKREHEERLLQEEINRLEEGVNKVGISYQHYLQSQDTRLIFDTPIQENLIEQPITQTLKNDETISLEENVVSKITEEDNLK